MQLRLHDVPDIRKVLLFKQPINKPQSMEKKNVFEVLNAVNVNGHTEQKNGLTYLSWAWAWAEVKKNFPDAIYTIYENQNGWNYHTDGRTCWVKTGVTINGLEHIEYLPVMDYKNRSIPVEQVTSFDVNKAIQRSLTKAAARHGLGLYIYAGEDLPETETDTNTKPVKVKHTKGQDTLPPVGIAIAEVEGCVSRAELNAVWNKYSAYQSNSEFVIAVQKKASEYPKS